MPEYLSPGVYVEEIPSAIRPIAGVSTSTACFLGLIPDLIQIPSENPVYDPSGKSNDPDSKSTFILTPFSFVSDKPAADAAVTAAKAAVDGDDKTNADATKAKIKALKAAQDAKTRDDLAAQYAAKNMEPILCTTFTDFKKHFGGFSTDGLGVSSKNLAGAAPPAGLQNRLAHAVYGFFDNGGHRCYVMRFKTTTDLLDPENLEGLDAIEEISLIAAPGITDPTVQKNLIDHCERLTTRFAILDPPELALSADLTESNIKLVDNSDYAALYFPRIAVFDIAAQLTKPAVPDTEIKNGDVWIGPSGHMAGIYARVDYERGVHKAPANEPVRGALDFEFQISRSQQDGLNPHGVNCLRYVNGAHKVWGARTIGGDMNSDLKYINVRRTMIFLRESIDQGTQWVVFEPNDRSLWAKITRNVVAFLTTVWRDGALFGSTPAEAFYVKCDDETNPPEDRDLGRVTTEIGVAIVKPAEFVIFHLSQWSGPQGQQ